ncbi:MAG: glycosyl hydrolase, partial [Lentisphaerota bacterium]
MDNLEFSDPANVVPPQEGAVGFPDRSAGFDALPGFKNPPRGYGQVPFYWWIGDPLTKERLAWQLEQLDRCGEGIMGLQINYAHGYRDGGLQYGLSIPSDPPLFSEAWWELVEWFMGECKRRGWSVSLSDYTLGPGQGWCFDELLKEHPEMAGATLCHETLDVDVGDIEWELPPETLMVAAYPLDGDAIQPETPIDLRAHVAGNVLKWLAPIRRHRLVAVAVKRVKLSLDPMHPDSGRLYAEKFFGQFEKRFPGEAGRGLNFFFSDELNFNVKGNLWNDSFAEEFRRRKGYDIVTELPSLFSDCGSRTTKVRLDYSDVMVALSETGFFKPVFDWHQSRGMIYGCDHGGRGRNVIEFGDYFRTQRWNQGSGCDQPNLSCDLIKNKVASSIAHLYQRPRVWLEGYYGSGWGTSTEGLTRATFANFAQGQNLLSLHGLYYSTHGGYWEWAPPCNHFRMPYWPHMKTFLEMVQRLSFVMSQGYHCCDVAILYPVAAMEAGLGGKESVDAAFDAGRILYSNGIDFDFMDFESLDRAEIAGKELHVSNERYRVLVLPAMRAIRWSTLQKALEFQNAGGLVIMLGALPEASDRAGRNDSELNTLVAQLNIRARNADEIATLMENVSDFAVLSAPGVSPNFMHRRIGPRDLF